MLGIRATGARYSGRPHPRRRARRLSLLVTPSAAAKSCHDARAVRSRRRRRSRWWSPPTVGNSMARASSEHSRRKWASRLRRERRGASPLRATATISTFAGPDSSRRSAVIWRVPSGGASRHWMTTMSSATRDEGHLISPPILTCESCPSRSTSGVSYSQWATSRTFPPPTCPPATDVTTSSPATGEPVPDPPDAVTATSLTASSRWRQPRGRLRRATERARPPPSSFGRVALVRLSK